MVFEIVAVMGERDTLVGPGVQLRQARENARISLKTISKQSKIPLHKLRALEDDNYSNLGAAIFIKGYIRQYAQHVGVDAKALVEQYEKKSALPESTQVNKVIANTSPKHLITAARLTEAVEMVKRMPFSALVAAILVIWLLAVVTVGGNGSEDVELRETLASDHKSSHPVLEQPTTLDATVVDKAEDIEESLSTEIDVVEAAMVLQELSLEQIDGDISTRESAVPTVNIQLDEAVFTFSQDCWVEIIAVDGEKLFAGLKKAGDSLAISGVAPFNIMLGNAKAATLLINGKAVDTDPGPRRKTLRLLAGP